jgi:hypothetical protein
MEVEKSIEEEEEESLPKPEDKLIHQFSSKNVAAQLEDENFD